VQHTPGPHGHLRGAGCLRSPRQDPGTGRPSGGSFAWPAGTGLRRGESKTRFKTNRNIL
jgi:hypothetical protein